MGLIVGKVIYYQGNRIPRGPRFRMSEIPMSHLRKFSLRFKFIKKLPENYDGICTRLANSHFLLFSSLDPDLPEYKFIVYPSTRLAGCAELDLLIYPYKDLSDIELYMYPDIVGVLDFIEMSLRQHISDHDIHVPAKHRLKLISSALEHNLRRTLLRVHPQGQDHPICSRNVLSIERSEVSLGTDDLIHIIKKSRRTYDVQYNTNIELPDPESVLDIYTSPGLEGYYPLVDMTIGTFIGYDAKDTPFLVIFYTGPITGSIYYRRVCRLPSNNLNNFIYKMRGSIHKEFDEPLYG